MRTSLKAGRFAAAAVLSLFLIPTAVRATLPNSVSLRLSNEVAPPGGIAQMKVAVTEPRPISTGGMSFFADFDFAGIAVMSPANDTYGVAQIAGTQLRFAVQSPSGTFGTASDYPIFTVALRVPATTSLATVAPISMGGDGLQFVSPTGSAYTTELKNGSLTVAPVLSIDDVTPGSADLPAGSVVTISGHGFRPTTRVRFEAAKLQAVRYVDSTRMLVVLGSPTRMHGQRIRAENIDGTKTTYFSYQRTTRHGTSGVAALQNTMPLFPMRLATHAEIDVPGVLTGVALQNIGSITAVAILELVSPNGRPLAWTWTTIRPNQFRMKEISELFGITYGPDFAVRVWSDEPIQAMGVAVDASGETSPIVPR
jgi:hypothetical protein